MNDDGRPRLFVAIKVADPAASALARVVTPWRRRQPGLRWVAPEQWHVTLAFVGAVGAPHAAAVDRAAELAARDTPPLTLAFDGSVEAVGGRLLWASVRAQESLAGLAARLRQELFSAGFPTAREPFVPHCTLARTRRGTALPARLRGEPAIPAVAWRSDHVLVLRSRLQARGARYERRSSHPLTG